MRLEGVDISIFDHLILEKFYVEDQQKDTLLYTEYLGINIDKIRIGKELIALDKIRLKNLVFNLKYDTAGVMNLQFVLDAFSSDSTAVADTTESTSNWKINCTKIILENASLAYYVPDTAKHIFGMNYNDLKISPLNLYASNLMIAGNSIMCDIDSLNLRDKSGFNLKRLSSNVFYGNTRVDLNKFALITDNSNIYFTKLKMTYESLDAFSDFMNKVYFNIEIPDSTLIGMRDAAYFEPSLLGFDQEVKLTADIKGTLSELDAKYIDIQYGKNTRLTTNFKVTGLPDIDNTAFNITIDTLTTSITDLNSIKDPARGGVSLLGLPTSIESVGRIYYKGNIRGKISELFTKGKVITGIGNIDANINVVQKRNGVTNISGNLIGDDLSISDIVDNQQIGRFDIRDTLDFNISKSGDVEGVSNGKINNLELLGYKYESVTFDAIINKYVYQGELKIDDPNVRLELEGMFVTNDKLPKVKFNTKIDKFVPYKLNLYDDSLFTAKLKLDGSALGLDPDLFTGKLNCDIDLLTNKLGKISNKQIKIEADYDKIDSVKNIQILSDFADIKLLGDIKLTTIGEACQKYLYSIMPSLADSVDQLPGQNKDSLYTALTKDNNFDFDIKLKNLDEIIEMFVPGIKIKPGTNFSGKFNLERDNFYLQGYCAEADISGTRIEELILNGDNREDRFNVYVSAQKIYFSETNSLDNSLIHTYLYNDKIYLDLDWNSFLDSMNYSGDFSLTSTIQNRPGTDPLIQIQLDSSTFSIEQNHWTINSNDILIDTGFIDIGNIYAYSNNKEKIDISGRLSDSKKDTLRLKLEKIELSSFNSLIDIGADLQGTMYGSTEIVSVLGSPKVNSTDSILSLQLDEHKLGDIRLNANWDDKNSILDLYAETQLMNTKNMVLTGKYDVGKDLMNFNIDVNRFPFAMASPFVQDFISDISGTISGRVTIKGTSEKPDVKAGLKFVRSGFRVNMLNTYYTFTDSFFIDNNKIYMNRMKINAGRNSFAWLSGRITHKNFDDIKLDISLEPRNFLFLQTQQTDSSYFYGTVYASGGINLKGDVDNMDINIKLKTERGTRFFLPLSSSSEVSESNYVTFVKHDTTSTVIEEEQTVDLSGININFELEATSDAEMQIIMDETVGDMIKVRGMGNLDIKVNSVGDIFLFGTYTVTKGDYLFTLQNLVNKKFIVDQGSTIRWNGDPYNAIMDMTAVYKIRKVSLYNLMLSKEYEEQKTNAECLLGMKGSLMDPRIEFGLNLPDAKEPVTSNINGLAQDDLNQQILSLLILGQFQPLPGLKSDDASAGGGAISNNAFEMLSNQLSNWLSKISDDFDIGVNYKQGGEMTSDEVEVALSTQLFNDRVSINTNVGVGAGTGTSSESTSQTEQNSANKIVGDVEIEVKLNKKGSLRSKVFNRTNQRNESNDEAMYTQGVGVFYRKEFNTFPELGKEFWKMITLQTMKERKEEKRKKKLGINEDIELKDEDIKKSDNQEEDLGNDEDNNKKPDNLNKDINKKEDENIIPDDQNNNNNDDQKENIEPDNQENDNINKEENNNEEPDNQENENK